MTESQRRYAKTEKAKAVRRRYYLSEKGIALQRRNRAKHGKANDARRAARRRLLLDALKASAGPCVVCRMTGPSESMEFHHKPGTKKLFTIGNQYRNKAWSVIVAEAAKCVIVCGNHHSMITSGRFQLVEV